MKADERRELVTPGGPIDVNDVELSLNRGLRADPLDTPEGRALVEAAIDALRRRTNLTDLRFVGEQVLRAVLAATNEHGESIVVLRSRLERFAHTRDTDDGPIRSVWYREACDD